MEHVSSAQADIPGDVSLSTRAHQSRHSASSARRENILRLVEMLLQSDGEDESDDSPLSSETSSYIISDDEHLQELGAKAFDHLQRCVDQLDDEYWASCLRAFDGQSGHRSVQRYIHELSVKMGDDIAGISSSLSTLVKIDIPTIRAVQAQCASNLLNLSTVAALFSAVTATTLQFSFQLPHSAFANTVNCLWFSSLVFSTAAAVNGLLGGTWKQVIRSPGNQLPWLALIWIKCSPLAFLMISVACFSAGLCCFAFATNQARFSRKLPLDYL